jgi:hypothetical protein
LLYWPKVYISHWRAVFFNEFGYYTVFNNILTVLFDTFTNNVSFPLGVMVNYGDLQFAERIMVARRSEMSAEWKVGFAICIASVAIQAFTNRFQQYFDIAI